MIALRNYSRSRPRQLEQCRCHSLELLESASCSGVSMSAVPAGSVSPSPRRRAAHSMSAPPYSVLCPYISERTAAPWSAMLCHRECPARSPRSSARVAELDCKCMTRSLNTSSANSAVAAAPLQKKNGGHRHAATGIGTGRENRGSWPAVPVRGRERRVYELRSS